MNVINSGGLFRKVNLKEVAKELFLDSFIVSYFRVLPTDDKFKNLSEETKELLYYMVIHAPSEEALKNLSAIWARQESIDFSASDQKILKDFGLDTQTIKKEIENITFQKF